MTSPRLAAAFPEFGLIRNDELRAKAVTVWETALYESGWTLEGLSRMPFTLLVDPCPVSFIEHVRAVTLTALRAAEVFEEIYGDRVPVDKDILITGGLLHDIGKLAEYHTREDGTTVQTPAGKLLRHPFTGLEVAARCGLPAEVQHIIATHAGEGDKAQRSTEATIINHADFMNFHSILRLSQRRVLSARMG